MAGRVPTTLQKLQNGVYTTPVQLVSPNPDPIPPQNSTQPTTHIAAPPPGRKLIPDMRNRDAWWAFLTGRPATEWDAPKKPKGQRGFRTFPAPAHTYGRGMRAFADVSEYEVVALQYDEEAPRAGPGVEDAHTHMSDEREVEQAITINPAESLPTPSSTPAPDNPADRAPTASSSSTSGTQPEPTPSLLRGIDHVRLPSAHCF